uniref:26S protease regulatory subunit 6B n=1 Tax=Arundo donax TaxID=35708 RepID=A0A0A9EDB6_ARUDO
MNMIAGAFSLAKRNTSRTILGPSPKYFCTNSEPTTLIKAAVV